MLWGAFDPPVALQKATALVPDPDKNSPSTPAPGSPVTPPHASATATTSPVDPEKQATHSPTSRADPHGPEQPNPHPPDPVKFSANNPMSDPQDPDKQKPDTPDPVQPPAYKNNDDPTTSAAIRIPLNGGNVAQGDPKVISDPKPNDPRPTGGTNERDPEADPGNGHNAGPASDPAENIDQFPADHAQPLPSIRGHQIQAANGGGIVIASTTTPPDIQTTIDSTPISVDIDQIIVASSTIPLDYPSAAPIITLIIGDYIRAGGKAAIVSDTMIALTPNGDALVVNGKISPLPISILRVAGQTLTAAPTGFAVGGQSLLPEGSAVTYAGSVISLASGSNALSLMAESHPYLQRPFRFSKYRVPDVHRCFHWLCGRFTVDFPQWTCCVGRWYFDFVGFFGFGHRYFDNAVGVSSAGSSRGFGRLYHVWVCRWSESYRRIVEWV